MDNIETVQKMYDLFATGKTEALYELFDAQVKWHMMKGFPGVESCVGVDAVFAKVFSYFRENWTSWKAVSTRYVDSGDGVFVIGYYEGVYKATGKHVRADFASEYKVKDGKITEYNQYTDTLLIAQAMEEATINNI